MPRPKPRTRLPKHRLTRQDVDALIDTCNRRAPSGVRNRALIAVLYHSMLRIQEALDLHPADVYPPEDGGVALIDVKSGKGCKQRMVPLSRDGWAYLEAWLTVREQLGIGSDAPVFCQITRGRRGLPVQSSYVRHTLPRIARRAGIQGRVHAHGLRYSAATNAMSAGMDLRLLRDFLGHTDISTTSIYLATATSAELQRAAARITF